MCSLGWFLQSFRRCNGYRSHIYPWNRSDIHHTSQSNSPKSTFDQLVQYLDVVWAVVTWDPLSTTILSPNLAQTTSFALVWKSECVASASVTLSTNIEPAVYVVKQPFIASLQSSTYQRSVFFCVWGTPMRTLWARFSHSRLSHFYIPPSCSRYVETSDVPNVRPTQEAWLIYTWKICRTSVRTGVSNSIYLGAAGARVWVRLGRIGLSPKKNAFIKNRKKMFSMLLQHERRQQRQVV